MLSYATIFIVSLIVAVIAIFLYKVISDSSRSVYSSKDRIAIINRNPANQKHKVKHNAVSDALSSLDRRGHVTQRDLARTVPAMPVDSTNSTWKGSGNQVHEQNSDYGIGAAGASHCSLYDVRTSQPEVRQNRGAGWPHREEKLDASGKTYKVKRKPAAATTGSQAINKPWGW